MPDTDKLQPFNRSLQPDKLQIVQRQLTVAVLSLVAIVLLFQLGIYFADIIRILIVSILFSYLLINIVDWLEKVSHNRALAIMVVYAVLVVAIIISMILLVPAVIYQVSQLLNTAFNQFPQIIKSIVSALHPLESRLHAAQIQVRAIDILTNFAASLPKPDPAQIFGRMSDVAMSTMTWLFYALSIIVMSFYFLLDGRRMRESVIRAFPHKHYVSLTLLATDIDVTVQAFFRGQIVLGLFFGAVMFGVYSAMGIHYALLLSVVLGVWEIVPVIGPTIGFIPTAVSVALDGMDVVHMSRWGEVLLVLAVFNLLQWVKDNIVAPKYIGDVIGLHPVMIFIAIMIGAKLDGMAGVICSLPAACVLNVLVNHQILSARASRLAATSTHVDGVEANSVAVSIMAQVKSKMEAATSQAA
jgi:predicted PurR-regulated permease PerM